MTIVDISELDTFVRDSLFNVRKGIANSRNTTQSNPLLGVMVDLPDKIDFEIVVTSAYQSLDRISSSIESRKDIDAVVSGNNTADHSSDISLEQESSLTSDSSLGSGTEKEAKGGSEAETDKKSGTGTETANKSGNGTETDNKSGAGAETANKSGTGAETDNKGGAGAETDNKSGAGIKINYNSSKQTEVHKESNDRASKTFDEEEGEWGGQGQISTPIFLGGASCKC